MSRPCPECNERLVEDTGTCCSWCVHKKQTSAAAKRRREAPNVIAGVDVKLAAGAMRKLPVFREHLLPRALKVEVGQRATDGCGGRAWRGRSYGRIRVYGGAHEQPARVLEVTLHELCHLATPGTHHGERFRRVFARACREAWGIEVSPDVDRGNHSCSAYNMGDIVIRQLTQKIAAGGVETYAPKSKPKTPKPKRDLVAEREAHAVKMLKRAESRLKRAKTIAAKWRTKVRYYERQAAKR